MTETAAAIGHAPVDQTSAVAFRNVAPASSESVVAWPGTGSEQSPGDVRLATHEPFSGDVPVQVFGGQTVHTTADPESNRLQVTSSALDGQRFKPFTMTRPVRPVPARTRAAHSDGMRDSSRAANRVLLRPSADGDGLIERFSSDRPGDRSKPAQPTPAAPAERVADAAIIAQPADASSPRAASPLQAAGPTGPVGSNRPAVQRVEPRDVAAVQPPVEEVPLPSVSDLPSEPVFVPYQASLDLPPSAWPDRPAPGKAGWLRSHRDQVWQMYEDAVPTPRPGSALQMPDGFLPWWHAAVVSSTHEGDSVQPVDVESLIISALQYSQRVRALSDLPIARESAVVEAAAEFDARLFTESRFLRTSEPVGNTLTTGPGGSQRFRDQNWTFEAGIRRKNEVGGQIELSQQYGLQDTNSVFFEPTDQGTARLTLSYTQPLLNGAGRAYNNSLTVLAQLDAELAWDQLSRELQDHLLQVTTAYWRLYLERALLQQKREHYERARSVLVELEQRQEVDALQSQVIRARAAAAARHSEMLRAEAAIQNAEANIRSLVNAPYLWADRSLELVPREAPATQYVPVSIRDSLLLALENRPEIDEALRKIRGASIQKNVSQHELLPVLNFVMETYVSGLEGDSDIGEAWNEQFSEGEPSYSVGLQFELPFYNRAAKARLQRRRVEVRQLVSQFRASIESLLTEVEVAVREVNTSYQEMLSKYNSMQATRAEVDYLQERWRLLPGDDRSASFLLEDLLDAQDRLATEESLYAQAQLEFTVSQTALKRATGTLLQAEQVSPRRESCDGLPTWIFDKVQSARQDVELHAEREAVTPEVR